MGEFVQGDFNSLAERRYAQAVARIYTEVANGAEGVEARVLRPVLEAALGYLDEDSESWPDPAHSTQLCADILHRLQVDAELEPEDAIGVVYDPSRQHALVSYQDSAGRPYALDMYRETIEEGYCDRTELEEGWMHQVAGMAEIHGDIGLTTTELLNDGLGPVRSVSIDTDTDIALSAVYEYRGRKAVVAYVVKRSSHTEPADTSVTARTFYLSNSQGVWRYLPSHSDRSWYNKGHGEDSLAVPAMVQATLADLSHDRHAQPRDSARVFFGTARSTNHKPGITYLLEVERRARYINSAALGTGREYTHLGSMTPPERLAFDEEDGDAPDYESQPVHSWVGDTAFNPGVTFEVITSKNQELKYVFAVTVEGHAWLAYVEDNSDVQSVGVRETWVKPGNFSMPLVEYASQDGGYGVTKHWLPGNYVDMWDKYLSKAPFIQQYLASRENR